MVRFSVKFQQNLRKHHFQTTPKVIFISTQTGKENYLYEMATTMAGLGRELDFILVKNNNTEPVTLDAPFKVHVIGRYFNWSRLHSIWVLFKIMLHAIPNIRSCCVYIVEDLHLVPILKFFGNIVAFYKKIPKVPSTLDAIIGNICLSKADVILISSQEPTLRFEKVFIVDPSEASTGVSALTQFIYQENPRTICTIVSQSENESRNRNHGETRTWDMSDTESAEGCQLWVKHPDDVQVEDSASVSETEKIETIVEEDATEKKPENVCQEAEHAGSVDKIALKDEKIRIKQPQIADLVVKLDDKGVKPTKGDSEAEEEPQNSSNTSEEEYNLGNDDQIFKQFPPKSKAVHFKEISAFHDQERVLQQKEESGDVTFVLN